MYYNPMIILNILQQPTFYMATRYTIVHTILCNIHANNYSKTETHIITLYYKILYITLLCYAILYHTPHTHTVTYRLL